jgi:hypothetical protein
MRPALGQQAVFPDAEILEQPGHVGLVTVTGVGIAIQEYLPGQEHPASHGNRRGVQEHDVHSRRVVRSAGSVVLRGTASV